MIRSLLLLALALFPGTARARPLPPRPPSPVRLQFDASEIDNLATELDCMAGVLGSCSEGAFRALWKTELEWSTPDELALQSWKALWHRYEDAAIQPATDAPPVRDYLETSASLDVTAKIRLAAAQARTPEEYGERLSLVMGSLDAEARARILGRFLPRFHRYWTSKGQPQLRQVAERFERVLREAHLDTFTESVRRFYGAVLPANAVLHVHMIVRPPSTDRHSHSRQLENHAYVEVLGDARPEEEIGVVLHELFHHFYASVPLAEQRKRVRRFVDAPQPNSLFLYNLMDEVLATALGNGLADKRLRSPDAFAAYFRRPRSFYSDDLNDKGAKALMPVVEKMLAGELTLSDPEFVQSYLRSVEAALGPEANSPLLSLRIGATVTSDDSLAPAANALATRVGANRNLSLSPVTQAGASLEAWRELSFVVLMRTEDLGQLAGWAGVVGPTVKGRLESLTAAQGAVVFGVRRTPKAWAYFIVGRDSARVTQAVHLLLSAQRPAEGVMATVP